MWLCDKFFYRNNKKGKIGENNNLYHILDLWHLADDLIQRNKYSVIFLNASEQLRVVLAVEALLKGPTMAALG